MASYLVSRISQQSAEDPSAPKTGPQALANYHELQPKRKNIASVLSGVYWHPLYNCMVQLSISFYNIDSFLVNMPERSHSISSE